MKELTEDQHITCPCCGDYINISDDDLIDNEINVFCIECDKYITVENSIIKQKNVEKVKVKSTQNFKDVASKIFSKSHNVGAGGVKLNGGIDFFPETSQNFDRYVKRVTKSYLIFGDEQAIK